jgi:uncharacterized protein YjiS (DUF1127 family)
MSRVNMAIDAFDDTTGIRRAAQRQILSTLWSTVAASVTNMLAAYAEWRRISRAVAELDALSDHMLRDIGIARHDIVRIARDGRDATDIRA